MNRGNKILLGALVVQLALVVVMLTRDTGGGLAPLVDVAAKLDITKVTKVQVFGPREPGADGDEQPALVFTSDGTTWSLTSHHDYPADGVKVLKLLGDLSAMKARGPMTKGVSRHIQLGVADGDYERKVIVTDDTGDRAFYVGQSAGGRLTAVRRGGESQVYGVRGVTAYGIEPSPRVWIDSTYTTLPNLEIAAIDVTTEVGTMSLDRSSGTWALLQNGMPVALAATETIDTAKADGILSGLAKITALEPGDPARDASKPTATIVFRMKVPAVEPPPPLADGGVPAISEPPPPAAPPRTFDVIADGQNYWLRERGNPRAVIVAKSTLEDVLAISRDTVVTKAEPTPSPG